MVLRRKGVYGLVALFMSPRGATVGNVTSVDRITNGSAGRDIVQRIVLLKAASKLKH